ncbi:MAG: hypothetical protein MJY74_08800 [Bacteroidaceae bacterium]|nr:hypothetical protein [Bacteroidaceae bacterium]
MSKKLYKHETASENNRINTEQQKPSGFDPAEQNQKADSYDHIDHCDRERKAQVPIPVKLLTKIQKIG